MATKRKTEEGDAARIKHFRSAYNVTINVLVGGEEIPFTVHKDLICARSIFFAKACSGQWSEAKDKTVRLPEMDVNHFSLYLEKLYSPSAGIHSTVAGLIQAGLVKPDVTASGVSQDGQLAMSELCKLWMTGDFLHDHNFQNAVMDELLELTRNVWISAGIVEMVVTTTTAQSGLRTWLCDALAPQLKAELLEELTGRLPADFLMALLKQKTPTTRPVAVRPLLSDKAKYRVSVEGGTGSG